MNQNLARRFRTLLLLSRVTNLPTLWSNCLAGWWLSGGGNWGRLALLLPGVSALYLGGVFLNDAFDAESDRQRRAVRPIPEGLISAVEVWRFGWGWLGLGVLLLFGLGKTAGGLALLLVASILIYNWTHKFITASPWLMGLCRFWVYVLAGTTGAEGLNGWPIWCGLALAVYVAGLHYVARCGNVRGAIPRWPLALLAAPLLLALVMDRAEYRWPALWLTLVLSLWVIRCLRPVFEAGAVNVGRIVSGLVAGVVFVDWLAVAAPECPRGLSLAFLCLFGATQALQRCLPGG